MGDVLRSLCCLADGFVTLSPATVDVVRREFPGSLRSRESSPGIPRIHKPQMLSPMFAQFVIVSALLRKHAWLDSLAMCGLTRASKSSLLRFATCLIQIGSYSSRVPPFLRPTRKNRSLRPGICASGSSSVFLR